MATNRYNGRAAELEPIPAGTGFYRILPADATYDSNSYNMKPRRLDDRKQGRFEPVEPSLGGYTYVSSTLGGAVAEGILRNQRIPASGLVRRIWLVNKKLVKLRLLDDIQVAAVYGPHTAVLNLDGALLCCNRRGYSRCRKIASEILLNTPNARGLHYDCRNDLALTSLMLITRSAEPKLELVEEREILRDDETRSEVLKTLNDVFHLQYTGKLS
ncbi:hypothetical protein [Mycobacterium sp. SMC-19]|uniref:hypothetical protein n=1 Tax=Mycobacterium sp. SMC-19 TaxID=3381630 RepID=UPI00387725D6